MLKCGGDVVTKWMVKISQVAWEGGASRLEQKPSLSQFTKGRAAEGSVGAIEV